MQHDSVLTKKNFDLLTPTPKSTQGVRRRPWIGNRVFGGLQAKYLLKYLNFAISQSVVNIFTEILQADISTMNMKQTKQDLSKKARAQPVGLT